MTSPNPRCACSESGGPTLGEYMTVLLAQWLAEVV